MHEDTGELKRLQDLNEAERKSGKWKEVPDSFHNYSPNRRLREQKRIEYMERVAEKKRRGENV